MTEEKKPIDASELFAKAEEYLDPPPWIDFKHPDFPEYFQIIILDNHGNAKSWWQRLPERLRINFPL